MNPPVFSYRDLGVTAPFVSALRAKGFAFVEGAPIDWGLLDRFYCEWARFFSSDEKYEYPFDPVRPEGCSSSASRNDRAGAMESFYLYRGGKWPCSTRSTTEQLYSSLFRLAIELLEWLAREVEGTGVARLVSEPARARLGAMLRVIHYPPGDRAHLVPHTDLNLVTLLPPATAQGLQILDESHQWTSVAQERGRVLVQVGDELQRLSMGDFRSAPHRVVRGREATCYSRYAVALFVG